MTCFKEQGNALYKEGQYLHAAAAYSKAIKEDPANHVLYRCCKNPLMYTDPVCELAAWQQRWFQPRPSRHPPAAMSATHSNRSAALLKLNKLAKALADADECLTLDPSWPKGWMRKGLVLESQGQLQQVRLSARQARRMCAHAAVSHTTNKKSKAHTPTLAHTGTGVLPKGT